MLLWKGVRTPPLHIALVTCFENPFHSTDGGVYMKPTEILSSEHRVIEIVLARWKP
jgi:hypothetical protein